jgi:secreted PhoX family phosphatase
MGRFKHGVRRRRRVSDGRVAVHMGDDTRFEDVYKFVTADR